MHYPLHISEISQFLHVEESTVAEHWSKGSLKRSISCFYRAIPELSQSSIYDVLEFSISNACCFGELTPNLASSWIDELAELDELFENIRYKGIFKSRLLLKNACDSGLAKLVANPRRTSVKIVKNQLQLLLVCKKTNILHFPKTGLVA